MWTDWTTMKKYIWLLLLRGASAIIHTVTGTAPLVLENAIAAAIKSLKQYGKCTQPSGVWNTAVTQYGKCEQRNLPQGYTELDYIQSDGNQYLDLNTTLNQDDVIEIEFEITASQNSKNIFGYRASASENNIMLFFGSASNRVVVDFNNSAYAAYRLSYDVSIDTRYKAVISKSRRAILAADGTVLAENTTACPDTITCPSAYLFAASGTPAYASGSPCKVYSCVINGKRNLVGAKDASNVVEMYDMVTDAPFVNAGTGSFTAGATATPTPDRPMDIVTNNGALKYGLYSTNLCNPALYTGYGWFVGNDGTVANNTSVNGTLVMPCKPNTTYSWWHTAGAGGCRAFELPTDTVTVGQEASWAVGNPAYTDANVVKKCTTSASAKLLCVLFGRDATNVGRTIEAQLADLMLVEGDITTATPYEPYKFGLHTVGTPETLTVQGKNLFDISSATRYRSSASGNSITTSTFTADSSSSAAQTYGMAVKPNTTYTVSKTGGNRLSVGGFRTVTVPTVSVTVDYSFSGVADYSSATFTTPADCVWILVCFKNNTQTYDDATDIQLELGSTATAYEPYHAPQTVTDIPMLLSVGDYKDEVELVGGLLTHKIGIYIFDGTENWEKPSSTDYFRLDDMFTDAIPYSSDNPAAVCTHFNSIQPKASAVGMVDGDLKLGWSNRYNRLYLKYFAAADVPALKAWLAAQYAAGTPVIIIYPLATEITEQTTAYPQLCNKLYNTADITAEVDDISVTFTTSEQTVPNPYSQLPIMCNNGELKWNGTSVVADGTPEVLTVSGKNLINESASTLGIYVNPTTGVIEDNSNYCTTEKMYLANGTYTYSQDRSGSGSTNDSLNIATYNADDTPIEIVYTSYKQSEVTFTLSGSYAYVRISYRKTNTDIMLEAGETATAYEAYSAQTVSDIPMLLSVGDYADEAELISGIKTGKVGVYVFTGEETGVVLNGAFRPGATSVGMFFPKNVTLASSHFKSEEATTTTTNMPDGSIKTNQTTANTMYMKNLACADVAAYQAWLAAEYAKGTPVIVLYPLATEITESGTEQPLTTSEGTNTVSVTSNVDPVELEIKYSASA